jgi:peptide/nickel transport system substrate-binding protein
VDRLIARIHFLAGVLGVSGVLLTACSPSTAEPTSPPKHGGTVTVAIWKEPHGEAESLLSCNVIAESSHTCAYVNPVMEGLLTVKASSDSLPANPTQADYWTPQLATEVPTLANGDVKVTSQRMDVTWKLRHNVKWQDGVPFTSQDVKSTFDFWWLKYRDKNPTPPATGLGPDGRPDQGQDQRQHSGRI